MLLQLQDFCSAAGSSMLVLISRGVGWVLRVDTGYAILRCGSSCCFSSPLCSAASAVAVVYPDGRVCISILHNPGDDPNGYETAAERWSPVQSVSSSLLSTAICAQNMCVWARVPGVLHVILQRAGRASDAPKDCLPCQMQHCAEGNECSFWLCADDTTEQLWQPKSVLRWSRMRNHVVQLWTSGCGCLPAAAVQVESIVISIIAMLSSPNDESPANVDAAKQWREDREGFRKRVARCVRKSQEQM